MMFSGLPRHSGSRVTGAASTARDDLLRRLVGVHRDHLGAMEHHVGHREVAQVEHAAEHVEIVLLHPALVMQEVDGAAQLLVRAQDRLILADLDAEQREHPAHQHLDPHQQRPEQPDQHRRSGARPGARSGRER